MTPSLVGASVDLCIEGAIVTLSMNADTIHVIVSETERQRAAHVPPHQLIDALLRSPDISWSTTREGARS